MKRIYSIERLRSLAQRVPRTFAMLIAVLTCLSVGAEEREISGIYPHLTMRNEGRECGTGAVVPWQGSLWAITYPPHSPAGSSDKLYEVTTDLQQRIFKGSVGGTHANRMIHKESNQLLIGLYVIDGEKNIRVISPEKLFGRLTGIARHLSDPANKVYYATMEEGFYEVNVNTLETDCLMRDGNRGAPETGINSQLPGYHGKGLYSGQGRVIYANNGERHPRIAVDPTITSGALAEWHGEGDWQMVRRNQFTEVTGPGGIHGNENPQADPVWSMGWDARSLILALLEDGQWYYYRLPKGSHSYDGSHGWNTEWPRIREIGQRDLLATMHGTFWRFPAMFSRSSSAGIAPRSNYLKVVGDFCRWNDRIVLGCDDSAASEFINTRPFKAKHGGPKQSNSNLWFIPAEKLDQLGPPIGRGSVWLRDEVKANTPSDPYLFSGYDYRQLHLTHQSPDRVTFTLEIDTAGNNTWQTLKKISVSPGTSESHVFTDAEQGAWIRLQPDKDVIGVTANFQYRNKDGRGTTNDPLFAGIASMEKSATRGGLMRSLAYDKLGLVTADSDGEQIGYYELNSRMELVPVHDAAAAAELVAAVRPPANVVTVDAASVVLVEDGKRYRLPKNDHYIPPIAKPEKTAHESKKKTMEEYLRKSLARGATVNVSATHEGYKGEFAVDGIIEDDSRWIAPTSGEKWIELDLGEPKTFRSIGVVSGWKKQARYAVNDFEVQMKHGDQWKTLPGGKIQDNMYPTIPVNLTEPVTAQHIRLVSPDSGFVRIYEIGLFDEELDIDLGHTGRLVEPRVCREVATERDLLNVHGTFYELPARNAQGMAKIRPIATHNLDIHDFCSHNGLLFFTGIDADTQSEHIFRSSDGKAAVWAGVVDDLWTLGKPRGDGGPWNGTEVEAGVPSDPYLMTAYDRKSVKLSHGAQGPIKVTLEVDIDGTGLWVPYETFAVKPEETVRHAFPDGFSAYWVRAVSDTDTTATVQFEYR
ncbi:MAG: discoidin domain-containing protein [bacterium]